MDSVQISSIISQNLDLSKKCKFRKRVVLTKAIELLDAKHILSLVGVRRCVKSTIMKELVRVVLKKTSENNILYLNLENSFFNQYKNDVSNLQKIYELFFEQCNKQKKIYVFFDEIQFFNDWQVFIKNLYEKSEAKIVLTGSNSQLLSSELATLLSGRTIPLYIYPFSLDEAKSSFDEYLVDGGFPEIVLDEGEKKQLVEIYYKNILYQDIIPRSGVQNILAIENLSYYLKDFNFNKIYSSDLKRAVQTSKTILKFHNNLKIIKDKRLREIDHGDLAGKPYKGYYEKFEIDSKEVKAPNGENYYDHEKRVKSFINELISNNENKDKETLIVSHGGTIGLILLMLLPNIFKEYSPKNEGLFLIDLNKRKLIINGEVGYLS